MMRGAQGSPQVHHRNGRIVYPAPSWPQEQLIFSQAMSATNHNEADSGSSAYRWFPQTLSCWPPNTWFLEHKVIVPETVEQPIAIQMPLPVQSSSLEESWMNMRKTIQISGRLYEGGLGPPLDSVTMVPQPSHESSSGYNQLTVYQQHPQRHLRGQVQMCDPSFSEVPVFNNPSQFAHYQPYGFVWANDVNVSKLPVETVPRTSRELSSKKRDADEALRDDKEDRVRKRPKTWALQQRIQQEDADFIDDLGYGSWTTKLSPEDPDERALIVELLNGLYNQPDKGFFIREVFEGSRSAKMCDTHLEELLLLARHRIAAFAVRRRSDPARYDTCFDTPDVYESIPNYFDYSARNRMSLNGTGGGRKLKTGSPRDFFQDIHYFKSKARAVKELIEIPIPGHSQFKYKHILGD